MNIFVFASFVLLSTLTSFAFSDSRSSHVSFGTNPDGTCWKKVVANINGKLTEESKIIDKVEADAEMKEQEIKRQQQMKTHQDKISQQFQQVHQSIANNRNKFKQDFSFDF